jgi:membrane protein involved in colicin uptake
MSRGDTICAEAAKEEKELEAMLKQAEVENTEQKKKEKAEKKQREAEAKKKAEEARKAAESAKRKAVSSKGKSKAVVLSDSDEAEEMDGLELPKMKKRKLGSGKSKTDEMVVEAVVPCLR